MKIVFQSISTLIILLIGIGVFLFIPSPSKLLSGTGIIGLILYPLAIAFYVSMVGILSVSIWNLIAFIFKEESYEEDDYAPPISNNKKYNYRPNIKVKDLNTVVKYTHFSKNKHKKSSLLFSTFKMGSLITGISFSVAFALLAYFIHIINSSNNMRDLETYYTVYKAEDYNDSRIIHYRDVLENVSRKLIQSKGTYEIFEADAKRRIALKCIEVFRKEHNATKPYRADMQIKHFKLNARNQYAKEEDIIEKSRKIEKYLKDTAWQYVYPRSSGYGLDYRSVGLEESCKKEISVDEIYEKFMPFYIKGQERKLENLRINAITSSNDKYFIAQKKWMKILAKKYPDFLSSFLIE